MSTTPPAITDYATFAEQVRRGAKRLRAWGVSFEQAAANLEANRQRYLSEMKKRRS